MSPRTLGAASDGKSERLFALTGASIAAATRPAQSRRRSRSTSKSQRRSNVQPSAASSSLTVVPGSVPRDLRVPELA